MTNMMVMMMMMIVIANDDDGGDGDHDYHDEARAILARCGASSVASAIYAANDLDGHTMMVMITPMTIMIMMMMMMMMIMIMMMMMMIANDLDGL